MPEEDIGFPGGTIIGTFEQPDVGAKNQTQALCKNIICSYTLSHLPNPQIFFITFICVNTHTETLFLEDMNKCLFTPGREQAIDQSIDTTKVLIC